MIVIRMSACEYGAIVHKKSGKVKYYDLAGSKRQAKRARQNVIREWQRSRGTVKREPDLAVHRPSQIAA